LPNVERVLNVFPQLQITVISLYSGWILGFMAKSVMGRKRARKRKIIPQITKLGKETAISRQSSIEAAFRKLGDNFPGFSDSRFRSNRYDCRRALV